MINKDFSNLSPLCFGCEPLGGSDWGKVNLNDIEAAIERSLELGINFFDTADVYGLGLSEKRLSKILKERRFNLFIATKGGVSWIKKSNEKRAFTSLNLTPEYITEAVHASLRRLRLDVLPLYYIHWPDANEDMSRTFECLSNLQRQGKINHIGCSNFNTEQLNLAIKRASIDFIQVPINILQGYPDDSFINLCNKFKIKIVAYNVLAAGMLTGKFTVNTEFPDSDRRSRLSLYEGSEFKKQLSKIKKLKVIAESEKLSLTQYSIKSVLDHKDVDYVITGLKTSEQAEENISVLT